MTDKIGSGKFAIRTTHDKAMKGVYQDVKEFNPRKALELLPDKTLKAMKADIEEIVQTRGKKKGYIRVLPDKTLQGIVKDFKDLTRKDVLVQLPDKTLKGILEDIKELVKL